MVSNSEILSRLTGDFKVVAELVGVEAALEISRTFGGLTLSIPKLSFIHREERDEEIRNAYDRGEPVRKLTLRYGLTVRQIYTILKEETRGDSK
ncbi:MAG: hypothetical protein GXY80_12385 [Syntrophorhabdus aromaticivorans]|uniref:Mor transcription activator domain-containing protein n=1 Tax=Syntrophorhabdus aromaticivorans TaxID=328301 RepID=A0A971M573_9BACT|nr:hypothetical protein [Syntrophorhabdus aromaticivorans]